MTFLVLSYISMSHDMNHPWKYLTSSIVINKLMGTKLFINTHHVPNLIMKK